MPNPGNEHVEGQTEVWIQDLLVALLHSLQREQPNVLELGGFLGHTSLRLAEAMLCSSPGKPLSCPQGTLTVAEYDPQAPERAQAITDRLLAAKLPESLTWRVLQSDALTVIGQLADESLDFAYVDDSHEREHVIAETNALFPKMRVDGMICYHDVYGVCKLHEVVEMFGGFALKLPMLGPAGGLGILQIR